MIKYSVINLVSCIFIPSLNIVDHQKNHYNILIDNSEIQSELINLTSLNMITFNTLNLHDFLLHFQNQIIIVFLVLIFIFIYELGSKNKKTKELLEVDTLTGLMTQYKFSKEARRLLDFASEGEYMIILLDIDKFKSVNKYSGFETGNKLLKSLARSMTNNLSRDSLIGRIQGDTFIILTKSKKISKDLINLNFENELNCINIAQTIHFSIGVYVVENTKDEISFMIDCARITKNQGKSIFGDTVYYFTKEIQEKIDKESLILSSMESAIEDEEFIIVIQPKIELHSKKIIGGEVLVRWVMNDGSVLYPNEFIPLFEENHFIVKLDQYVLKQACKFIRDTDFSLPILSINVSATTILNQDFISKGLAIMEQYGVTPQQIEIELTESVLDTDFEQICKTISTVKKLGFTISIDDFGKGASSLARLKEIEIDVLKIDKVFIEDNSESERGKLVLSKIISMANDLGIITLAEGIETKQQHELLIELGCTHGQGYYFDQPLSCQDFILRLKSDLKITHKSHFKYSKDFQFWSEFKDLSYGVAIVKNDRYSTLIQANDIFYELIEYTKESFKSIHRNRITNILVDNLYNLVKKYLDEENYTFSYDIRILTASQNIIWVHDIVKYDPINELFFISMIKIVDQNKFIETQHDDVDTLKYRKTNIRLFNKINDYYNADKIYIIQFNRDYHVSSYFEFDQEVTTFEYNNCFTIKKIQAIVNHLNTHDTIYFNSLGDNIIYSAIKDCNNSICGFIGVENPRSNQSSFDLVELLACYVEVYTHHHIFTEQENHSRFKEESSKANILNLCINMLNTTTTNTTNTTSTVLELLCKHYDAKSCVIINFYNKERKYKISHMNSNHGVDENIDFVHNFPFTMIDKVLDKFEQNKFSLINDTITNFFDEKEVLDCFKRQGIDKFYLAPMFDTNNVCQSILLLTNPNYSDRSPMLVQIVAKFISDYQVKYTMYLEQKKRIALEPLTKLYNKVTTEEKIDNLLKKGNKGVLFIVDVDNFKQVNDSLGHATGDKVIITMASELRRIFNRGEVIGRIGGDEFIIFTTNLNTKAQTSLTAQLIVDAFNKSYGKDTVINISASIGICTSWETGNTFHKLYKTADKALYQAKENGKNQYCYSKI